MRGTVIDERDERLVERAAIEAHAQRLAGEGAGLCTRIVYRLLPNRVSDGVALLLTKW